MPSSIWEDGFLINSFKDEGRGTSRGLCLQSEDRAETPCLFEIITLLKMEKYANTHIFKLKKYASVHIFPSS